MSSDRDIYQILESLDAAQKSVKQLPALFRPAQTSPQLDGAYPGKNATQGYLVGEGEGEEMDAEQRKALLTAFKKKQLPHQNLDLAQRVAYDQLKSNPMAQAVIRRISNAHPEWFMKYGPDAVMQAVDDVTDGDTDWEEIGSSDVSAYVDYVRDALRDRMGSREEMDHRRPFAEEKDDDEEAELNRDGEPDHGLFGDDEDEEQGVAEAAKWRDPKYKGKLYTQEPGDSDDYDNIDYGYTIPKRPENDPGQKRRMGGVGSEFDRTDPLVKGQGIGRSGIKHSLNIAGKRKGLPSRDQITSLKGSIKDTHGKHTRPNLPEQGISEDITEAQATEDVLSDVKKKLGDYLQDVATAIKKDPDLVDKIPQDIDSVKAVKTIKTDDGHEIKILGNEDDGFRISIKNNKSNSKFSNLDEAVMAVEMFCARRRSAAESADYIEEKQ